MDVDANVAVLYRYPHMNTCGGDWVPALHNCSKQSRLDNGDFLSRFQHGYKMTTHHRTSVFVVIWSPHKSIHFIFRFTARTKDHTTCVSFILGLAAVCSVLGSEQQQPGSNRNTVAVCHSLGSSCANIAVMCLLFSAAAENEPKTSSRCLLPLLTSCDQSSTYIRVFFAWKIHTAKLYFLRGKTHSKVVSFLLLSAIKH